MPLPDSSLPLQEWQTLLQNSILNGDLSAPLNGWIKSDELNYSIRVGIYIDAYALRLIEALKTNYPAMHQLLGDDDFDVMARSYLERHSPEHASIRWFGNHLADYLAAQKPYIDQPVFAELAQFEWALRHTIDAADAQSLSVENLQAIDPALWPELRFGLHPSISILTLQWNTAQIWQALTQHESPPAPQPHKANWLIYRQADLISAWRSASDAEISSLRLMTTGKTFADLCEHLLVWTDDAEKIPPIAAGFLRGWTEQGLLVRS